MSMAPFDELAASYEGNAVAQKGAAEVLLELLPIGPEEDVLDVGCGPGHLTRRLRLATRGRVEGVDASAGMIEEARRMAPPGEDSSSGRGDAEGTVRFAVARAEDLPFEAEFDAIFCNSAFHWFHDTARALARMRAALRPGGRLGIQAPATRLYCPSFVAAMARVAAHPETRATFARFRSPWLFLESAAEYAALVERAGFAVALARLEAQRERQPPEGAMRIFESGAVAGYLAQEWYDVPVDATFAARVREIVRASLAAEADADGMVELVFHRVFLVATKA
jgi:trans-aconitate methyltransferase